MKKIIISRKQLNEISSVVGGSDANQLMTNIDKALDSNQNPEEPIVGMVDNNNNNDNENPSTLSMTSDEYKQNRARVVQAANDGQKISITSKNGVNECKILTKKTLDEMKISQMRRNSVVVKKSDLNKLFTK